MAAVAGASENAGYGGLSLVKKDGSHSQRFPLVEKRYLFGRWRPPAARGCAAAACWAECCAAAGRAVLPPAAGDRARAACVRQGGLLRHPHQPVDGVARACRNCRRRGQPGMRQGPLLSAPEARCRRAAAAGPCAIPRLCRAGSRVRRAFRQRTERRPLSCWHLVPPCRICVRELCVRGARVSGVRAAVWRPPASRARAAPLTRLGDAGVGQCTEQHLGYKRGPQAGGRQDPAQRQRPH
jgi:hypothetical protein